MIRNVALALLLAGPAGAETIPEPSNYRGEPYRAPVPATLTGAEVIGIDEALALHDAGQAAFVDVMPRKARPEGLPEGTIWNEPLHQTIPGAIWLFDTGYQALAPAEEARLRDGLTRAQGGDADRPLVLFCRSECWMSWNAARRAVAWGFDPVIWFPGGTDAWTEAGRPLVMAEPVAP
ncbi:PQQ-dependent catabolism-associated CXXCW motif protein [Paracoccus liaowanqingii]|uniref:PQQ-dependent catabolism-associated CXXCW motif protein n=1 Tax=Paracoccus liaowanqingii TaxID=2560053 RepID=A0A4Z1CT89_9RHOB|nr:PQQ-dependent catabolism-associated CXXCW motif protein [Paracoccus liaowanqingii]TGN68670.1 PQQ-dependent catabolism-associated CXXCW motif protein [Paracoccus liaowanqingii]